VLYCIVLYCIVKPPEVDGAWLVYDPHI